MRREDVELHERSIVEEQLDTVSRGQFAGSTPPVGSLGLRMQRLVSPLAVLVDLLL
jgi:hypothetical protein